MITKIIPNFVGKRWLKISLRSFHLVGIAGVFAMALTGAVETDFWLLAITTGIALLILESLSNLVWFFQVRALAMYIKFALLYGVYILPEYALYWLSSMIVLSSLISHAPSSVRYYSVIHGKKITSLNDVKG